LSEPRPPATHHARGKFGHGREAHHLDPRPTIPSSGVRGALGAVNPERINRRHGEELSDAGPREMGQLNKDIARHPAPEARPQQVREVDTIHWGEHARARPKTAEINRENLFTGMGKHHNNIFRHFRPTEMLRIRVIMKIFVMAGRRKRNNRASTTLVGASTATGSMGAISASGALVIVGDDGLLF